LQFADHIQYFCDLGFAELRFADSVTFCGLKTSTNSQIHNFPPYMAFHSLKYIYVANIRSIPMHIWIRNTAFFFAILRICICGLGHQENLWIWDWGISPRKIAALQRAD
jgi:hypothetical protein